MAIQKFDADLNILSKLSDYPSEDGLETDAFKAKFDLGPNLLKEYINDILIPEISKTVDEDTVKAEAKAYTDAAKAEAKAYTDAAKAEANAYTDAAKAEANAYTDASVRKAAPHNLLDNSDFRNPVNQRGKTSYTADEYTIDRWIMTVDVCAVNVTSNGLNCDATDNPITFVQFLDDKVLSAMSASGKKYTLAINYTVNSVGNDASVFERIKDGSLNLLFALETGLGEHTSFVSFIPNSSGASFAYSPVWMFLSKGWNITLRWAALYEGEYTAETLPEYHPKGYGAELAECKRYYQEFTWLGGGTNFAPVRVMIPLPLPMRIANPTVTFTKLDGEGVTSVAMVNNDAVDVTVAGDYARLRIYVSADL